MLARLRLHLSIAWANAVVVKSQRMPVQNPTPASGMWMVSTKVLQQSFCTILTNEPGGW